MFVLVFLPFLAEPRMTARRPTGAFRSGTLGPSCLHCSGEVNDMSDASFWVPVIERLQAEDIAVLAPPNPLRGLAHDAEYIASYVNQVDVLAREHFDRASRIY